MPFTLSLRALAARGMVRPLARTAGGARIEACDPFAVACGFRRARARAPAALARALHFAPPGADLISLRNFVGNAVVSWISFTLASLLAYAVWCWSVADGAWRAEELHAHDP
jgi:hypothetical protein